MKKRIVMIVSLLALLVIVMIGSIVFFTGGISEKVSLDTVPIEQSAEINGSQISGVEVFQTISNIEIIPADNENISVQLTGRISEKYQDKFKLEVRESDSKAAISVTDNVKWFNSIGPHTVDLNLEIRLPEKIYESITVEGSIGDIHLNELKAKEMIIEADIGDILAENIKVQGNFSLFSNIGELDLRNVEAGQVKADVDTGDVMAENVKAKNSVIYSNLGGIGLQNIVGVLDVKSDIGSVSIMNKTLNGDIKVRASNGDVDIKFDEKPNSLILQYQSDIGDADIRYKEMLYEEKSDKVIKGKLDDGKYLIDVYTKLGDFSLR